MVGGDDSSDAAIGENRGTIRILTANIATARMGFTGGLLNFGRNTEVSYFSVGGTH